MIGLRGKLPRFAHLSKLCKVNNYVKSFGAVRRPRGMDFWLRIRDNCEGGLRFAACASL